MTDQKKTLRLILPHWQGGKMPTYQLGSRLLAWLAPCSDDPTEEVPVAAPDERELPVEWPAPIGWSGSSLMHFGLAGHG